MEQLYIEEYGVERSFLALGEGTDDGVPGEDVWFGHLVEHLEGVGKVTTIRYGGDSQHLGGDEGISDVTRFYGSGVELAKVVAAFAVLEIEKGGRRRRRGESHWHWGR